jgi:2-polyprenyl-3-methyl-5-hydroxy-6-metoxy-1,4-benzoquinol methylase
VFSLRTKRSNLKVSSSPYPSPVDGEGNSWRDCQVARAPLNDIGHSQFDFDWDDAGIFPEVVYPDAEFLFRRMNEVTLESVDARRGETILDIGCGRGIDGVEMAKKGALVIGLEPSNVMIRHAGDYISHNGLGMSLVQGVGEYLPCRLQSVDKVVCKGALDHFPDPAVVIEQIALVLGAEGKAIIAIANFDSLGFRLGKMMWWFRKFFGFKASGGRMLWEVPEDHTYKFDYPLLSRLVKNHLRVEQAIGVSLFFGLPWWGMFLAKCPKGMALAILNSLDRVARYFPSLGDVIVLKCRCK